MLINEKIYLSASKLLNMKLNKLLFTLFFSCSLALANAQDIHYSLFDMSPTMLNPALTGAFSGTARIGGIIRTQDFTVSSFSGYNTPSVYIDAPVLQGFGKRDWIGVGLTFLNDQAGDLKLTTQMFQLSGSYHLALDKKGNSILTLGVMGGSSSRKYNVLDGQNNLFVTDQTISTSVGGQGIGNTDQSLIATQGGASGGTGGKKNVFDVLDNFQDYNVGLMFRTQMDKDTKLEVGATAGHFTLSKVARDVNSNLYYKPLRIGAHAIVSMPINDKWGVTPKVFFQTEAKHYEALLQAWADYDLNQDMDLHFGLGYRFGDAAQLMVAADYKDIRAAFAYDVTLSSKTATNSTVGGVELAVYKILKVYKKPVVKPAVLCPRF